MILIGSDKTGTLPVPTCNAYAVIRLCPFSLANSLHMTTWSVYRACIWFLGARKPWVFFFSGSLLDAGFPCQDQPRNFRGPSDHMSTSTRCTKSKWTVAVACELNSPRKRKAIKDRAGKIRLHPAESSSLSLSLFRWIYVVGNLLMGPNMFLWRTIWSVDTKT